MHAPINIAVGQEQISSVQGPKQWNSIATSASTTVAACPKCGIFRNNNSISCCAPGGSWFNQCGTTGDPNFKHSYADGVCACKNLGDKWQSDCKQQDSTMKANAAPTTTPATTTVSLPAFGQRDPHVCTVCTPPNYKSQIDSCPSGYFCCPFQRLCLPWRTSDCLCRHGLFLPSAKPIPNTQVYIFGSV